MWASAEKGLTLGYAMAGEHAQAKTTIALKKRERAWGFAPGP
jgi:hypothetical protein